jgi:mono/diheme cytochrome c family protein
VSRRRLRAAPAAGLAAALLAACGGAAARHEAAQRTTPCASRSGLPSSEASARLVEGARVFDERCTPCHGDAGYGDGVLADLLPVRPRNYHDDRFEWGTSWQEIERTVRLGRSDVMPSFEGALTDSEIRSVALLVTCWVAQRESDR